MDFTGQDEMEKEDGKSTGSAAIPLDEDGNPKLPSTKPSDRLERQDAVRRFITAAYGTKATFNVSI
jgi:hypothetical protein